MTVGAMIAEQLCLREQLERPDDGEQQREQDRRPQERYFTLQADPRGARPVDRRRFVQRAVDGLEGREQDDHVVARVLPRHDIGEGGEGEVGTEEVRYR